MRTRGKMVQLEAKAVVDQESKPITNIADEINMNQDMPVDVGILNGIEDETKEENNFYFLIFVFLAVSTVQACYEMRIVWCFKIARSFHVSFFSFLPP